MRYAKIISETVSEVRNMADNFDPAAVAHKFDFRIIVPVANPAFDPATEKLHGYDYVVYPEEVTATRKVVALSQGELDGLAEQAERDIAKTFYQDLKDGTGTQLERLVRVERVLARLLKDAYE